MYTNFSLHTFEVTYSLLYEDYCEFKDAIFNYLKGSSYEPITLEFIKGYRFRSLSNFGINSIELFRCIRGGITYRYSVRLVINPRRLLGEKNCPFTGIATQKHLERTPQLVDEIIRKICPTFPFTFAEGKITRIDYCTNINLKSEERAEHYLSILRQGRFVRNMKPEKIYDKEKKIKTFPSGRMKLKNGSCELEIYLKQEQMSQGFYSYSAEEIEDAAGFVRLEFRVNSIKIYSLRKKYDVKSEVELLLRTAEISKEEMVKLLARVYGTGDFYSGRDAVKIISQSHYQVKTRHNMSVIIDAINKTKNISDAFSQLEINDQVVEQYMKRFNQIGISPITYGNKGSLYYNPLKYIESDNVNDGIRV